MPINNNDIPYYYYYSQYSLLMFGWDQAILAGHSTDKYPPRRVGIVAC